MKLNPKLIIFDLDGVLIDSRQCLFHCFNYALKKHGIKELTNQEYNEIVGIILEKQFFIVSKNKELSINLAKTYRDYYKDTSLKMIKLFPNAKETLEKLKDKILTIATSKRADFAEKILEHLNIKQYFRFILGAQQLSLKPKPEPDTITYLMQKFRIKPEETIFIGDTQQDIQAGKSTGVITIAATYGFGKNLSGFGYKINKIEELIKIIK